MMDEIKELQTTTTHTNGNNVSKLGMNDDDNSKSGDNNLICTYNLLWQALLCLPFTVNNSLELSMFYFIWINLQLVAIISKTMPFST